MKPESELDGVEKELAKKLRAMWDNDNFVEGVRERLYTDEERQWVIEGIDEGDLKSVKDVFYYVLQIREDAGDD